MLEKSSGKTWEALMQSMLFDPLSMKSAGFGAPATAGKVDQPWGHQAGLFGSKPVPPGLGADNPFAISPAGAVHCSTADLAKYASFHLAGARGDGMLLKSKTFQKLHTPVGDDYALGWTILEREWAGGKALWHNGSNTMFYALVWIAPERNFAAVAATNVGGDKAFKACDQAIVSMLREGGYIEP
jgi:CubicO group peptidase (beta-lactamase class C family)